MNAIAYTILVRALIGTHGRDSNSPPASAATRPALAHDPILAVALSFVNSWISLALFSRSR
jgi:hypothetical protein